MAWDVTVSDIYAKSHIGHTARESGAAANKASDSKTAKYGALSISHMYLLSGCHRDGRHLQSVGH